MPCIGTAPEKMNDGTDTGRTRDGHGTDTGRTRDGRTRDRHGTDTGRTRDGHRTDTGRTRDGRTHTHSGQNGTGQKETLTFDSLVAILSPPSRASVPSRPSEGAFRKKDNLIDICAPWRLWPNAAKRSLKSVSLKAVLGYSIGDTAASIPSNLMSKSKVGIFRPFGKPASISRSCSPMKWA